MVIVSCSVYLVSQIPLSFLLCSAAIASQTASYIFLWLMDLHQHPLAEKYIFEEYSAVWPADFTSLPPEVESFLYGCFIPTPHPDLFEQRNETECNVLLEMYISCTRELASLVRRDE